MTSVSSSALIALRISILFFRLIVEYLLTMQLNFDIRQTEKTERPRQFETSEETKTTAISTEMKIEMWNIIGNINNNNKN